MAENKLKTPCKAVVIGGSAGSIEVLLKLLPALPSVLSFTVIIVVHRKNSAESSLANLLSLKTAVPIQEVEDKDAVLPGSMYLAPADYHLLIEKQGVFSLDNSEKVNYSRPSLDVTFESAADVYGPAMVGILLSGANADGTAGLKAVKNAGGVIVAQKPETAMSGFMPQQAILNTPIDFILDVNELIEFVRSLNTAS
ncbi:two-component system chemotaxis response regulator CheB [Larkinella arboricola]|uniref:protein-glutamate methylesterase n=1 Tax=Larkinella arboricola TaxID=643671 RepID=A0A327X5K0_LARAB|nr:chemotaxis protein CheB [Larkinella arboricola]RAJ98168.1 two-component system chemotaxis response regulator CheB [Larkinella arboricola]